MPPQVTVFIDYQNAHFSAHEMWCPMGEPPERCLIDPLKLAEAVVAQRSPGGILQEVRVYRGRPDARKQRTLASANDKQWKAWMEDPRVEVTRRALWYPHDWGEPGCIDRPREKGIDVAIAVDLVRMAMEKRFEVGILFSRDTDLLPALEMVRDLGTAHVEAATWAGASQLRYRSGNRRLWCHKLDEDTWRRVRDTRWYEGPAW